MTPGQTILAMHAHGVRDLFSRCRDHSTGMPDLHLLAECAPLLGPVGDIDEDEPDLYDVVAGVALIPVRGTLVDRTRYIGSNWVTGYNVLRLQLEAAFADTSVAAIALVIDSSGGMASGLFDLVDWAIEAKQAAGKTLVAICDQEAYSAAYAVALIADTISVPATGGVGSIGAYIMHFEMSKWLKEMGDTYTIVRSGERKADANWIEPLPDKARADFQADVDALRGLFAERVAAARGIDVDVVLATEARAYRGLVGTKEAVQLNLADAVLPARKAWEGLRDFVAQQRAA